MHGKSHANIGGLCEKVGVPLQANNGVKLVIGRCREWLWGGRGLCGLFSNVFGQLFPLGYTVTNLFEVKGGYVRAKMMAYWFV